MKRTFLLVLLIFIISFAVAEQSSSSINWASHQYVNINFCKLFGDCTLNNLIVYNLSVIGSYMNVSVINYNVTGDMNIGGNLIIDGNVTADYFLGDGSQLTGIQQGELVLFFLNGDSPDVNGNKTLSSIKNDTEVTLSAAGLPDGSTKFTDWVTNMNVPNINLIQEGTWLVHVDGKKTGGTKDIQFYYEVYVANSTGGAEKLISTSSYSPILPTDRTHYDIDTFLAETNLNSTDRIRVKGYAFVSGTGSAPSVEAYIQGPSNTRITLPVGAVSVEKFVPYTGAVNDLDMGAYDLLGENAFVTGHMNASENITAGMMVEAKQFRSVSSGCGGNLLFMDNPAGGSNSLQFSCTGELKGENLFETGRLNLLNGNNQIVFDSDNGMVQWTLSDGLALGSVTSTGPVISGQLNSEAEANFNTAADRYKNTPISLYVAERMVYDSNSDIYMSFLNPTTIYFKVPNVNYSHDVNINGTLTGGRQIFSGYDSTGGLTVPTAGISIPIDTEVREDTFFTHSTSGDNANVTVSTTGDYWLEYDVSTNVTGSSRSQTDCWLEKNAAKIPGTSSYMYNRITADGHGTGHTRILSALSANDKIQIKCKMNAGTDTIRTVKDGTRFNLEWAE